MYFRCIGCQRDVEAEKAHEIKISCGLKCLFFRLCPECLRKHNEGQLSLEELRFSFPIQDRAAVRNMLASAF